LEVRKRLVRYILEYKWQFICSALLGAVVAVSSLAVPYLTGLFFKALVKEDWAQVRIIALLFIGLQLPRGISAYGQFYLVASATNRIATGIREELYAHLQKLSLSFFERSKVGHLMSRMTNDVGLIQNGSHAVTDVIKDPLVVIGGIARMFTINWILALIAVVFVPGMGFLINRVTKKMRKLTMSLQLRLADVTAVMEETIAGIRVVKSFNAEKNEVERFGQYNKASLNAALTGARRNALVNPVTETAGALAVVAIILVGGYLVSMGRIEPHNLFEFGAISFYVASAAKNMGRLNVTYHQTMAGMERILDILNEQPDIIDSPDAKVIDEVEGRVEFRNVSFSYQTGEQVLTDISFVMEPGKAVALVGASGSGKSTIANLIPRFYDVTDGAVLVDGHDVRDVTMESLRKHIGIVPQETILFSGTIRDNIAYGKPDATDEEIEQAARAANAYDFISQLEDGYQTVIGERGVRLSGGERQRISIARAILKDPRILILDEATSSLDATSERLVQDALEKLMQGRTTLVIAHRLSTITKADRIIVMACGKIVEQGAFEYLMRSDGFFARLYHTQFDLQAVNMIVDAGGSSETPLEKG